MTATTNTIRVVGLSWRPGYPENMLRLATMLDDSRAADIRSTTSWDDIAPTAGPQVLLVRNPDNEADPNAIEVHVPALGRRQFVGFIPKELAARWARRLDGGWTAEAWVSGVPIAPNYPDRPGLDIEVAFHEQGCPRATDGARTHKFCPCQ